MARRKAKLTAEECVAMANFCRGLEVKRKEKSKCKCCGEITSESIYCKECHDELKHGKLPSLGPSDRQVESMRCRNIRKGSEMS
jgi:hypothetical protein